MYVTVRCENASTRALYIQGFQPPLGPSEIAVLEQKFDAQLVQIRCFRLHHPH